MNEESEIEYEAYMDGYAAYYGESQPENPHYPKSLEYYAWIDGFEDAQQDDYINFGST